MKRLQIRAFHFPPVRGQSIDAKQVFAKRSPSSSTDAMAACPRYDAIVLSSGGVRGIAHLGALDVLHTHVPTSFESVRYFVGASAGAVVATMLALGYAPKDAMDAFIVPFAYKKDLRLHMLSTMFGVEHGNSLESFLETIVPKTVTFKQIHDERDIVLSILGTNLNTSQTIIFDVVRTPNMSVFDALRISCSVPLLFTAYKLNGEYVVDGAISNPFPVNVAMDVYGCTNILGLRFDSFSASIDQNAEWKLDTYLGAVIDTMIHSQTMVVPTRRGVTTDVVTITTPRDMSGIDFDLCADKKYDMFHAGSESMLAFLKKKT